MRKENLRIWEILSLLVNAAFLFRITSSEHFQTRKSFDVAVAVREESQLGVAFVYGEHLISHYHQPGNLSDREERVMTLKAKNHLARNEI